MNGIGPRLNLQVIARMSRTGLRWPDIEMLLITRLSRATRLAIDFLMGSTLPLTILGLAMAFVGLAAFNSRLIALPAFLSTLAVFLTRLIITALSLPSVLPTIGASFLRASVPSLISQHLAADTHAEQANCRQTPDVRFHDVPH